MKIVTIPMQAAVQDSTRTNIRRPGLTGIQIIAVLLGSFLFGGNLIQRIDPTAGILDIGILSVLLFALLSAVVVIFCSLWLQEILWKSFKNFRQEFVKHLNQLTSWQQCLLYFGVFFLWLYAIIYLLSILF